MTTYECAICLNINHVSKLHCSTCGTIPKQYSIIGAAAVQKTEPEIGVSYFDEVLLARGYDRAEWHHNAKVYFRTVPTDYYAE